MQGLGASAPAQRKTLLQHAGYAEELDEDIKRKAAAVYAANKQQEQQQQQQQHGGTVIIKPPTNAMPAKPPAAAANAASAGSAVSDIIPSIDQLKSAPRYGLNARELILQATAQLLQVTPVPSPSLATKAPSFKPTPAARPAATAPPAPAPRFNPIKLMEVVPPAARPQVKYDPRSAIPRLQRQGCADTLLGQYLGLMLTACKLAKPGDEAAAIQAIKSEEAIRKVASAAAAAHETSLFRPVTNKAMYVQVAARAVATVDSLVQHGGVELGAALSRYGITLEQLKEKPQAVGEGATKGNGAGGKREVQKKQEDLFGEEDQEGGEEEESDGEMQVGVKVSTVVHSRQGAGEIAVPSGDHSSNLVLDKTGQGDAPAVSTTQQHQAFTSASGAAGLACQGPAQQAAPPERHESANGTSTTQESSGTDQQGQVTHICGASLSDTTLETSSSLPKGTKRDPRHSQDGVQGSTDHNLGPGCDPSQDAKRVRLDPTQPNSYSPASASPPAPHHQGPAAALALPPLQTSSTPFSLLPPLPDSPPPPIPPEHITGASRLPSLKPSGSGGVAGQDPGVSAQVAEFARGVLDPLYRAQVISKQQYKDVVRRSVRKVMDHHTGATSAAFLLKEHEAVRRLVLKMVEVTTQPPQPPQP